MEKKKITAAALYWIITRSKTPQTTQSPAEGEKQIKYSIVVKLTRNEDQVLLRSLGGSPYTQAASHPQVGQSWGPRVTASAGMHPTQAQR